MSIRSLAAQLPMDHWHTPNLFEKSAGIIQAWHKLTSTCTVAAAAVAVCGTWLCRSNVHTLPACLQALGKQIAMHITAARPMYAP